MFKVTKQFIHSGKQGPGGWTGKKGEAGAPSFRKMAPCELCVDFFKWKNTDAEAEQKNVH